MTPPERPLRVDGRRAVADLRELARRTSDDGGAQRVAWTATWERAREWFAEQALRCGVAVERDPAGNVWAVRAGAPGSPTLVLGSHLDSVPDGGWLDGALGVVAGLEVLRSAAEQGWDRATIAVVDWADEEGSRFGHSLLGSSAACGLLDPVAVAEMRDADDRRFGDVAPEHGVDPATMPQAAERLAAVDALLELHIEQGPVLERAGEPLGVPSGAVGVDRVRLVVGGQAAHAGTTPLSLRRDAGLTAFRIGVAARELAASAGGLATTGALRLAPGIVTAVAERAELLLDLRHADQSALEALREHVEQAARRIAGEEGTTLRVEPVWATPAVSFDPRLVAAFTAAAGETVGHEVPSVVSGALHDAVAVARAGVPAGMLFVRSLGGISHNRLEDSSDDDLVAAVAAYAAAVEAAAARFTEPR